MFVRGGGLGASMSRYLIERIEATPNIELIFNAEVVGLEGDDDATLDAHPLAQPACARGDAARCPQSLPVRRRRSRNRLARRAAASRWTAPASSLTGAPADGNGRAAAALETTVPGVFAVGDVRSGSVKRVGGAIGEGAQVVAALHGYLGDAAKPAL